jgi:septal ring factor EnvC (AmiA/AmiB activator)
MSDKLDSLNKQIKSLVKEISEVKEEISLVDQNLKDLKTLLDKKLKDLKFLRNKRDGIEDSELEEDDDFQDIERSDLIEKLLDVPVPTIYKFPELGSGGKLSYPIAPEKDFSKIITSDRTS